MAHTKLSGFISVVTLRPPNAPQGAWSQDSVLEPGYDVHDGGAYYVEGTVKIDSTPDVPVKRKVRLICTRSGRLVRETWSDETTGAYRFDYVRQGPWTVISHDYTGTYNAVVADNITAAAY